MRSISALGDRLLGAMVPKKTGAACNWPSVCKFVRMGCGGGYCYYYFQWGSWCYAYNGNGCDGYRLQTKWHGCC